jgi:Na+/phosphate symporter
MYFYEKKLIFSNIFGFFTRLYLTSVALVILVMVCNFLGVLGLSAYIHQAIGAMVVTGVIWFVSLAIHSVIFADIQSHGDFASKSSPILPSSNLTRPIQKQAKTMVK